MKKIRIVIVSCLLLLFLGACDGTKKTSTLDLMSHLDGHTTEIVLETKVSGFNRGDILSEYYGKARFSTNKPTRIESLRIEIEDKNPHLLITDETARLIHFYEASDSNRRYSYFIKAFSDNNFMAGEMKFRINSSEEDGDYLVFLPYQYINDSGFDELVFDHEAISFNEKYKLFNDATIDEFLQYYSTMGWFTATKEGNELLVEKNAEIDEPMFLASFKLIFADDGYIRIIKV